jgi:hypothetical protein
MSDTGPDSLRTSPPREGMWWGPYAPPAPRRGGWKLLTGVVAVGLGVLAWRYLGPDLRRYLKIRSM